MAAKKLSACSILTLKLLRVKNKMFLINKLRDSHRQFLLFSIVGGVGFLVDGGILLALIHFFNLHAITARLFSFLVAVCVTWYLNRSLTFAATRRESKIHEWLRYMSANGIGALFNFFIYSLLILFAVGLFKQPIIALIISSACAMFFNFFASKHFAFQKIN